jgi:hypothetical protein
MSERFLAKRKMRLCAIYNVWDDWDWMYLSTERIRGLVDEVIIIASEKSNFGEHSEIPFWTRDEIYQFEPVGNDARANETAKRNYGLEIAMEKGHTHFIMMDADEFYDPEAFLKEKKRFEDPNLLGLVCRVKCYFKSPTLTIGYDTTLVPFIHRLTTGISHEFNKNYPFAWTSTDGIPFTEKKRIRIDPTRSLNINSGVEWSEITMFHMSWVRKDIKKKIRNSTARQNIERSTIVTDYLNAKEGYFCEFYGKTLERSPNVFGLPEIHDTSL